MATRSIGSCSLPSMTRVTTWGLPTVSSKPSRRMVSTSTASCSSPRPWTSQVSGRSVGRDPERDVAHQLGVEASLHQAGRELGALGAGQRRGVDADGHGQAGLVDQDGRQGPRVVGVGQGLADGHLGEAGHGHDLARPRLVVVDPFEGLGDVELGDLDPLDRAVDPAPGHRGPLAQRPVDDPADGQATDVGRGVEVGDQGLQRRLGVVGRAGTCRGRWRRRGGPGRCRRPRGRCWPSRPGRWRRGWGSRSGARRRRGRGTAPRPRGRPRRCGRRAGPPCSRPGSPAAGPRGPCAARSGSGAGGPRRRRPAAAPRRPWSGPAPPRRRSRRARGCRRC